MVCSLQNDRQNVNFLLISANQPRLGIESHQFGALSVVSDWCGLGLEWITFHTSSHPSYATALTFFDRVSIFDCGGGGDGRRRHRRHAVRWWDAAERGTSRIPGRRSRPRLSVENSQLVIDDIGGLRVVMVMVVVTVLLLLLRRQITQNSVDRGNLSRGGQTNNTVSGIGNALVN